MHIPSVLTTYQYLNLIFDVKLYKYKKCDSNSSLYWYHMQAVVLFSSAAASIAYCLTTVGGSPLAGCSNLQPNLQESGGPGAIVEEWLACRR